MCSTCGRQVEEFMLLNNRKYCTACYSTQIAQKCCICGRPLIGEFAEDIEGNVYHEECRALPICSICHKPIPPNTEYKVDNTGKKSMHLKCHWR